MTDLSTTLGLPRVSGKALSDQLFRYVPFIFPSGPYNPYLPHARINDGRIF
jgi:hypothetical protein